MIRKADELILALQDDVEKTILDLRGERNDLLKINCIGVPVCYSEDMKNLDWNYYRSLLKDVDYISEIKYKEGGLCIYGGLENRLLGRISLRRKIGGLQLLNNKV